MYTLGLSQLLVFIAVAMNTDGFFSYQCIRFIFSMIELLIFSMIEPVQYRLGHRETSQLDHRENKAYTLGLSQLLVFIAVAMNTDGFISYQCIRFIFSMIELRIFPMTEPVLYIEPAAAGSDNGIRIGGGWGGGGATAPPAPPVPTPLPSYPLHM